MSTTPFSITRKRRRTGPSFRILDRVLDAGNAEELYRMLTVMKLQLDEIFSPHQVLLIGPSLRPEGDPGKCHSVHVMSPYKNNDLGTSCLLALDFNMNAPGKITYAPDESADRVELLSLMHPEPLVSALRQAIENATALLRRRLEDAECLLGNRKS